ncbi:Actin-like ATPase [Glarea lozoyensis ATCC 20868]|uniref:Actin-like ATPase n=1 Tax=Glarea lozoyensis (strain ATCC 20868 / MF5171) TaxID=1116229 RepID=S3E466_GLAL2|nr:Actin-like ATPase [Glarea lozoyensis ATCC 20868]EPE33223.1 Actin-like ATPase [Glarea lozoyensis ATCC 20868]
MADLSKGLKDMKIDGDRLIVGFDFGTTFSGVAFAFNSGDKPDVHSIVDWPGIEGFPQPKVPTIIKYDDSDKSKFTWGAQTHAANPIVGIKLLLDPSQPRPPYLPDSNAQDDLDEIGKPAVTVAADYLAALYKHAMERIKTSVPTDYLAKCKKEYVLSVPAVWSDKAKDLTLKAAKQAGIHPVTLIKEPEAAALYTLYTQKDKSLAVDDAIVIVDAGGGTVDLISYEIAAMKPRLELKELVPSKGSMAGSLGLNKRFEQEVQHIIGPAEYGRIYQQVGYTTAVNTFDKNVKTAFRGDVDKEYFVAFPCADLKDNKKRNLKRDVWTMTGFDVAKIFEPLAADIESLVDQQVKEVITKRSLDKHPNATKIKAIFMVGGFGSSVYIKNRLQDKYPDIQVIQPHDAWGAIVKGAVLSKLHQQAFVSSNISPRHYGVVASDLFVKGEDEGQHTFKGLGDGSIRVSKCTWHIKRGDELVKGKPIAFPFYRVLPGNFEKKDLIFNTTLQQSDEVAPPKYPAKRIVKPCCSMAADLRSVSRDMFKLRKGADGKKYYTLSYDLVVRSEGAVMKFSLEIGGKEMGSVTAKYE